MILKVFDLIILEIESSKLTTDSLQFAYKSNTGTATCTWAVTTVVDHFTKFNKPVFAAAMDMSKAFDMVKWSKLFNTLLSRGVRPIFLRLLLFIYRHQQCNVKWGTRYLHCLM